MQCWARPTGSFLEGGRCGRRFVLRWLVPWPISLRLPQVGKQLSMSGCNDPGDLGQRDQGLPGVWNPLLGGGVHHPGHQRRRRTPAPRHEGQGLQHPRRGQGRDRSPLAGGSGCRQQHLRPGGELGPAQAPAHHFREDPRGRPAASALLAAADGRIRGPRRVAPAVLTAGHVLRPGSRDRERRHPDRRGHGAYGGGSSPQLPNFRMAKHSESLREGELMKRLLTLNHVQNL